MPASTTPEFPAEIIRVRLEQSSVDLLVEAIKQRLFGTVRRPLIVLGTEDKQVEKALQNLPPATLTSDVILATSGSTRGRPHLVGLSWEALRASAGRTIDFLGPARWLLPLPPHHIAGFQVLVRSVLLGVSPLVVGRTEDIPAAVAAAREPLITALVPTQLRRLQGEDLSGLSRILVGGARLDPALARQCAHLPLVTTYGMTETCGGCVYNSRPLPGIEVRIESGLVHLSGPVLMDGYLGEPSPLVTLDGTRYLVTSDLGRMDEGRLTIEGRADHVIISGGENLSPGTIEEAIGSWRPDLNAVVVGVDDPDWGQVAVAALEGAGSPALVGPKLRAAVSAQLGAHHAPRAVVFVGDLPLLSSGKVDRRRLVVTVTEMISKQDCWSVD
ncbi:AMP-binding protein [Actinomyces sp. F1_1611]